MALTAPTINGVAYDVSSYQITISGSPLPYTLLKELSYSESLEPAEIYGVSPQKLGRTRGKYSAEASLELWLDAVEGFYSQLTTGNGIFEVPFNIDVQIYEPVGGRAPIYDQLVSCRITKRDAPMPGAGDAASVKFDLNVMYILHNNNTVFTNPRLG